MNKVTLVKAYFMPVGENVTVKVPTGEKTKGIFGQEKDVTVKEKQWQQTGWSDKEVDAARLAEDLEKAVTDLNKMGYEVVTITPVISGDYRYQYRYNDISSSSYGYGYGYGFSYTDSLIITSVKKQNDVPNS